VASTYDLRLPEKRPKDVKAMPFESLESGKRDVP